MQKKEPSENMCFAGAGDWRLVRNGIGRVSRTSWRFCLAWFKKFGKGFDVVKGSEIQIPISPFHVAFGLQVLDCLDSTLELG